MTQNQLSNYDLFLQAAFNRPEHYPLDTSVSEELYRPIAPWMGRLILPSPEQRENVKGVLFEVHHADTAYQHLVGQVVHLRWHDDPEVQVRVWTAARDLYFDSQVEQSIKEGLVHPERLNGWRLVTPLESLAGARPNDDVIVSLREPVVVDERQEQEEASRLYISHEPMQITGRYYGLVTFLELAQESEEMFRVIHFNRATRQFDGAEEIVRLPQTLIDAFGIYRSTSPGIEQSPLNTVGWYIYGAKARDGVFVVQALAPRALLRLQPDQIIFGQNPARHYVKKLAWKDASSQKGKVSSVLLHPQEDEDQNAIDEWRVGDCALVVTTYGGITGKKKEPYPYPGGFYFGHYSYGAARVIHEPLADELMFDIEYYQVFSSNADGLIPGTIHWTRYIGDRQFGMLGYRPVCDVLIKLDAFTAPYDFAGEPISALSELAFVLESVMPIYRIGDGMGGVYFGVANNCTQDSNQALYAAIKDLDITIKTHPLVEAMLQRYPEDVARFNRLLELGQALKQKLLPFGNARADWRYNFRLLDSSLREKPLVNLLRGLATWRAMTPRWASNAVTEVFLEHGASVWVLRTNQVGNFDPDMLPKAIDP